MQKGGIVCNMHCIVCKSSGIVCKRMALFAMCIALFARVMALFAMMMALYAVGVALFARGPPLALNRRILHPGALTGEIQGKKLPETPATVEEEPENRLLTDAEMVTEEDPDAVDVNPEWVEWVKNNVTPVRSITHTGFAAGGTGGDLRDGAMAENLDFLVNRVYPGKDAGMYDVNLVPRDQYDGILFIDTTDVPDYL